MVAGVACVSAGASAASTCVNNAMKEYNNKRHATGAARADADSTCFCKVAGAGVMRGASYLVGNLIVRYGDKRNLPPHNTQTYLSAMAIVSAGILADIALAAAYKDSYERNQGNMRKIMSGASLALVLAGSYGFYKNV